MDLNTDEGMEQAKTWLDHFLTHILHQGGTWAIPRALATYRFDQKEKRAVRLTQHADSSTEEVLVALGYRIEDL